MAYDRPGDPDYEPNPILRAARGSSVSTDQYPSTIFHTPADEVAEAQREQEATENARARQEEQDRLALGKFDKLTPAEAEQLGKQPVGQPAIGSRLYAKNRYLQSGTSQWGSEEEFYQAAQKVGEATPGGGVYSAQIVGQRKAAEPTSQQSYGVLQPNAAFPGRRPSIFEDATEYQKNPRPATPEQLSRFQYRTLPLYRKTESISNRLQTGFEGMIGYTPESHPVKRAASGFASVFTGLPQFVGAGIIGAEVVSKSKAKEIPAKFIKGGSLFASELVTSAKTKPYETAGMGLGLVALGRIAGGKRAGKTASTPSKPSLSAKMFGSERGKFTTKIVGERPEIIEVKPTEFMFGGKRGKLTESVLGTRPVESPPIATSELVFGTQRGRTTTKILGERPPPSPPLPPLKKLIFGEKQAKKPTPLKSMPPEVIESTPLSEGRALKPTPPEPKIIDKIKWWKRPTKESIKANFESSNILNPSLGRQLKGSKPVRIIDKTSWWKRPTKESIKANFEAHNVLSTGRPLIEVQPPKIVDKTPWWRKPTKEYLKAKYKEFDVFSTGRKLEETPTSPKIIDRTPYWRRPTKESIKARFEEYHPFKTGRALIEPSTPIKINIKTKWWKVPTKEYLKAKFEEYNPFTTGRKLVTEPQVRIIDKTSWWRKPTKEYIKAKYKEFEIIPPESGKLLNEPVKKKPLITVTFKKSLPKSKDLTPSLHKKWELRERQYKSQQKPGKFGVTKQGQIVLQKQKVIQKPKPVEVLDLRPLDLKVKTKQAVKTATKTVPIIVLAPQKSKSIMKPYPLKQDVIQSSAFQPMVSATVFSGIKSIRKVRQPALISYDVNEVSIQSPVQAPVQASRQILKPMTVQKPKTALKEKTISKPWLILKPVQKPRLLEPQKTRLKLPKIQKQKQIRKKSNKKGEFKFGELTGVMLPSQMLNASKKSSYKSLSASFKRPRARKVRRSKK